MTSSRRKVRRSAVVLLTTGATCLVAAGLPLFAATAEEEAGSGFGSFSLAANAPVVQVREDYASQQCSAQPAGAGACEGVVNESVSTLRNGPIGHALSSVGWPGSLAGNLGSLLIVAGGAPPEATALNDPVKAENFTSSNEDKVVNSTVPGAYMEAVATATKVSARSTIGQAQATPLGEFGRIDSQSSTTLTGPSSAVAEARSQVQDVTVAGVLHLGAVTSWAKATTDGVKATAQGTTTVTGASVNGIPVTIDQRGVTVQAQSVPFPAQATDAVNAALTQAGITVAVSTPIGKPEGADVVYNAGSLVLVWKQQGDGNASVTIGGAQVAVASSEGFDVGGGTDGGTTGDLGGTTGTTTGGTGGVTAPLSPVDPGVPGGTTGTEIPPTVGEPVTTTRASSTKGLPDGLSPWLGVLAVLGAGLVMAGLRRLPDNVLVAPASACPQGDLA